MLQQGRAEQAMPLQSIGRLDRHSLTDTLLRKVFVSLNDEILKGVALAFIDIKDHQLAPVFLRQAGRGPHIEVSLGLKIVA